MISVGDPETAKRYAYKDSILDHSVSESLWAEQMLSAMESIAFLEKDIMVLVEYGIDQLPDKSKLKKCIYFIRSGSIKKTPWKQTRSKMLQLFGNPITVKYSS